MLFWIFGIGILLAIIIGFIGIRVDSNTAQIASGAFCLVCMLGFIVTYNVRTNEFKNGQAEKLKSSEPTISSIVAYDDQSFFLSSDEFYTFMVSIDAGTRKQLRIPVKDTELFFIGNGEARIETYHVTYQKGNQWIGYDEDEVMEYKVFIPSVSI